ncbi:MAG: DNA-processing protein DprA, partial [Planctomycetota bacterium]
MSAPEDFPPDLIAEVRLAGVRGVGPLLRARLVEAFGSAGGALHAGRDPLQRVRGVGPSVAAAIAKAPSIEATAAMLRDAASRGIRPIAIGDDEYPSGLREIHDPPAVMFCRGAIQPTDACAVAIVGTRRATAYGRRQAERFAAGLADAGFTVVSGLARGIDGYAHRAALAAGGRTIAALAGGLGSIYPPEHADLADEVAERGALLAEAPPPMPPMAGSFPQRNRIISGLALGVLVIEAAERSGALITARHAAEQGRDAFATPGPIESPASAGCHRLIQEGAKLVTSVQDVLDEVEVAAELHRSASHRRTADCDSPSEVSRPTVPVLPPAEQELLARIAAEPTLVDSLVDADAWPIHRVLSTLSLLETRGLVRRLSGS